MNTKNLLIFFLTMFLGTIAQAKAGDVVVHIENLRNLNQGELSIALYQKVDRVEMDFSKALLVKTIAVSQPKLTITFKQLPYGDYAVAILHDLNKDKKMQTNWIGIPSEDLAVSNNAKGGPMGGPKWVKAKFTLNTPKLVLQPIVMSHM